MALDGITYISLGINKVSIYLSIYQAFDSLLPGAIDQNESWMNPAAEECFPIGPCAVKVEDSARVK